MLISRLALGYLALTGMMVGVWALILPLGFYSDFPGLGRAWVSADGPYNGHLIRDVGAAYLMIAALAGLSLARPNRAPPVMVGVATLFFNVPHLAYHASHLGKYAPVDRVLNLLTLGTAVLCSAWLAVPRSEARS